MFKPCFGATNQQSWQTGPKLRCLGSNRRFTTSVILLYNSVFLHPTSDIKRMNETLTQRIAQIHATPTKLVFEFAGAGSRALAWLHSVAGSSRTMLEATDRYSPPSLAELLGATPEKFVSRSTAEAMAAAAYRRAVRLSGDSTPVIGVALTATIATDRIKRGDHGCWVAVCSRAGLRCYGLTLVKGARQREGEEFLLSALVIWAIAEGCGVADQVPLDLVEGERIDRFETARPDVVAQLIDGTVQAVLVAPSGERSAEAQFQGALLSGSFNPLHQGHERLAAAATVALNLPVAFEIPIVNADKPPLAYSELERRLAQFRWRYPVLLSRARLFVQKADVFPSCTFVLGYDTAARLIDLRYYAGEAGRDAALEHIRVRGCRFLVAGRVIADDTFQTLADLPIPTGFTDLFIGLSETAFRVDLSSSAIRAQTVRQ